MSLSKQDVEEILGLFERSSFGELRLETGDLKVHVRRAGAGSVAPQPIASTEPQPVVPPPAPAFNLPPPGAGEVDVLAPLLGVFYRAPKPGEPPFVDVGQAVEPETIIGLIEVMKLMNSARAGVRGEVIAIHAVNAEMVEYDQPLLRVRLAD